MCFLNSSRVASHSGNLVLMLLTLWLPVGWLVWYNAFMAHKIQPVPAAGKTETIWKAKVWHVRRTEHVSQEMAPSVGSGTSGHLIELGRPIACSIVIKVLQMTKDKALIQGASNINQNFIFDEQKIASSIIIWTTNKTENIYFWHHYFKFHDRLWKLCLDLILLFGWTIVCKVPQQLSLKFLNKFKFCLNWQNMCKTLTSCLCLGSPRLKNARKVDPKMC